MKLATTAALIATALALAACDSKDLERTIAGLTGELSDLHAQRDRLANELAASQALSDAERTQMQDQLARTEQRLAEMEALPPPNTDPYALLDEHQRWKVDPSAQMNWLPFGVIP